MVNVEALVARIDRQATRALIFGGIAFGGAAVAGIYLVLSFSNLALIPWGDFDARDFNPHDFLTNLDWPTIAGRLVLRVGAVLLGIFMIQLMFGFGRYYCRLASHMRMLGNLVLLSESNPAALPDLAAALLPSDLDFGRMPRSPIERVLVAAAEAVGRASPKRE